MGPSAAHAASAIFEYGGLVPGAGATPGSVSTPGPWARVTLSDTIANTVTLLVENLVPAPYGDTLTALVFNLSPSSNFLLSATCSTGGTAYVATTAGSACGTLSGQGTNNQSLSGGGQATKRFDLLFDLKPQDNNPNKALNGGETMTFQVTNTGAGPFSVSSLLATNPVFKSDQPSTGGYYSFAKFQSVGNGSGSVEVYGTPRPVGGPGDAPGDPPGTAVPGPVPLLGAAAGFGWSRKLRRRLRDSRNGITPAGRGRREG
ncbi:hypothetical protein [Synechococcus sp. CCY 9618]|uniref:hypothetical protein n=1 Tax=Synechococcus sp. CCY 9618 TaxID=2815602 RepID=UPI001C232A98|nr:hypothetical protein [Synechococcus sp. CCY 9618]